MNRSVFIGIFIGVLLSASIFGVMSSIAQEAPEAQTEPAEKADAKAETPESANAKEFDPKNEDAKAASEENEEAGVEGQTAQEGGEPVQKKYEFRSSIKSLDELDEADDLEPEDPAVKVVYKTPESCKEFTLYLDNKAEMIARRERNLKREEKLLQEMKAEFEKLTARYDETEGRIKKIIQNDPSNLKDNPELAKMIRMYEKFSPEEAAQRLQNLDLDLTIAILRGVKPKILSAIMAAMEPRLSAALSSQMVRGF